MKSFFQKIIPAALLLAILSSCVSIPSQQKMQAATVGYELPKKNQGNNVLVYIIRPSRLGAMLKFGVFVDKKDDASKVAYTTGKRYIYFFVKPGIHKIFAKAENWAEMSINGQPGEIIFMRQDPSPGFLLSRNSLEIIDEVEAKFHMKDIKKGVILKEGVE